MLEARQSPYHEEMLESKHNNFSSQNISDFFFQKRRSDSESEGEQVYGTSMTQRCADIVKLCERAFVIAGKRKSSIFFTALCKKRESTLCFCVFGSCVFSAILSMYRKSLLVLMRQTRQRDRSRCFLRVFMCFTPSHADLVFTPLAFAVISTVREADARNSRHALSAWPRSEPFRAARISYPCQPRNEGARRSRHCKSAI